MRANHRRVLLVCIFLITIFGLACSRPDMNNDSITTESPDGADNEQVNIKPPDGNSDSLEIHPDDDDAIRVVKNYLQALKNNDYDTWRSMSLIDLGPTFIDSGVTSLVVHDMEIFDEATAFIRACYFGSILAQHKGWTDDYIRKNMLVVSVNHTTCYDQAKVSPLKAGVAGPLTEFFILVRKNIDSAWVVWNIHDDADHALALESHPDDDDAVRLVKTYLHRDTDYDTRSAMYLVNPPSVSAYTGYGLNSQVFYKVEISHIASEWMKEHHAINHELAQRLGWSDGSIKENLVSVAARCTVYYDQRKVFYDGGTMTFFYTLVRKNPDSPWLILESYRRGWSDKNY